VTQGDGSGAAGALIDAINKNNERNPGKEVLFMNYAAVDPDLTNSKCSYWHFRLDADTSMKMEALTTFIKDQKDIHKVYLIGQNYAHGVQVAKYAKADLARKRPDIQIVGEDLHPLAKVTDFAPYVAKIKASGADTIITGNWGSDLACWSRPPTRPASTSSSSPTTPTTPARPPRWAPAPPDASTSWGMAIPNMGGPIRKLQDDFKAKFNDDFYVADIYTELQLLSEAMAKAKSTDPVKVAAALEGMRLKSYNGDIEMRKTDHQLQQDLWISVWQKTDAKNPYSVENTGYTFAPVAHYDAYVASTPTSCQMKRP
jgi:branched-chain amino acid transport system substrate-binding protein